MEPQVDILLVDDEPRNLDALEAILSDQGYRLLRADGADLALKMLLEHEVAAIVLDIKMPGVTGFELAKIIKGSKKFRQIPIVFLTAHMLDDQDVKAGYGAGAVDYLTKPVKPDILRHKVAVFAELFRKTRALAELNETLEERVKQRTAELEASEAALKAAAKQKDEFLAVLAHELRNPLAPLRTGLDLLLQMPQATPSVGRTLAAMNRQLDHMVRLIDDLLDVSRISRGSLELKKQRVELGSLIAAAVDNARPFFDRRKHGISVDVVPSIFAVADPTRVSQIIGNLLHNAAKFTPDQGNIRVELGHASGNATIRVIDSGHGIPADKLDRVFDMFAQLDRKASGSERGLGIGLSLSRKLAEMHGGGLTAESMGENRGTTFMLTLPATKEAGARVVVDPGSKRREGGGSLNILVIEDNHDNADTLAEWLESQGHKVHVARTGASGVELVQETQPQVVLCDIGLPGMDGIEVCRSIRGLGIAQPPVMIALSGWGMAEDRQRTKEAGFDHHLVKPVSPDVLFELLLNVDNLMS